MKLILAPMTKIQAASYATRMFMTAFTQATCVSHSLAADGSRYGEQPRRAETECFQRGGLKIPHRKEPICNQMLRDGSNFKSTIKTPEFQH